jgi:mutator protein MutT
MVINRKDIAKALANKLPGAKSHRKMLPPNRVLTAPQTKLRVKQSSVLLLLFKEDNELKACLIKRTANMKYHAGQIALPGGKIEKGETAEETALRETFEEVGIEPDKITILGKLSEFYVEVSRFQIQPIVGWLQNRPVFKTNRDEVEKVIIFSLKKMKSPFCEVEMNTVTGRMKVPCIQFENEIIWGATAMILAEFSDLLSQNFSTSE